MFKIAAILTSAAMLCTGTLLAAAPEASAACTEPAQAVQRCTVQRHAYIRICGDWWEIPLQPGEELPAQPPEEETPPAEEAPPQETPPAQENPDEDAPEESGGVQEAGRGGRLPRQCGAAGRGPFRAGAGRGPVRGGPGARPGDRPELLAHAAGWVELLYDPGGIRHLLPRGGGEHRHGPAHAGGGHGRLDELQRPPGEHPERDVHLDRRGVLRGRGRRGPLGTDLPGLTPIRPGFTET